MEKNGKKVLLLRTRDVRKRINVPFEKIFKEANLLKELGEVVEGFDDMNAILKRYAKNMLTMNPQQGMTVEELIEGKVKIAREEVQAAIIKTPQLKSHEELLIDRQLLRILCTAHHFSQAKDITKLEVSAGEKADEEHPRGVTGDRKDGQDGKPPDSGGSSPIDPSKIITTGLPAATPDREVPAAAQKPAATTTEGHPAGTEPTDSRSKKTKPKKRPKSSKVSVPASATTVKTDVSTKQDVPGATSPGSGSSSPMDPKEWSTSPGASPGSEHSPTATTPEGVVPVSTATGSSPSKAPEKLTSQGGPLVTADTPDHEALE